MLINTLGFQLKGYDRVRAIHKLSKSIEKEGDKTGRKTSILFQIKNNQSNNKAFTIFTNKNKNLLVNNTNSNKNSLNEDLISNNTSLTPLNNNFHTTRNNDENIIENKTLYKNNNSIFNPYQRIQIPKKYKNEKLSEQRKSHKFHQLGKNELMSKLYKLSPRRHSEKKIKNNNKIIFRNNRGFTILKLNKNYSLKNNSINKNFFYKKYNINKNMKLKKNQSPDNSEDFENIQNLPKFICNSQISIQLPKIAKISLIDKIYSYDIKNLNELKNQDYFGCNDYIFVKNNQKESISKIFMNNKIIKEANLNQVKLDGK